MFLGFFVKIKKLIIIETFKYSIMYLLCMEQRTTIQIEHNTLEKLKKLRITKRETYDEILNRLVEEHATKR